jgi:radical SAM-linked protein
VEEADHEAISSRKTSAVFRRQFATDDNLKYLFSYRKEGPAVFLSHLDTVSIMERSFQRAGIPVAFTQGFNPKPKLEFAHPLSLGIESENEVASVEISDKPNKIDDDNIRDRINRVLPSGFIVTRLRSMRTRAKPKKEGETPKKVASLMAAYGGSTYRICPREGREERERDSAQKKQKMERLIRFITTNLEAVESCTVLDSGSLTSTLFVKYTGKKSGNIMHLLKTLSAEEPGFDNNPLVEWCIVRLETAAGEKRQDYFDYFE